MEAAKIFPFLTELNDATLNPSLLTKIIPKGMKVFDEGDRCGGVPFILKGVIRVSKFGKNGREITLYRLTNGDACLLTITSVLSNIAYPATAVVEEEAEVVLLTVQQFTEMMKSNTYLQHFVYKLLSDRFLEVMTLIDELIFRKIDERLIEFLLGNSRQNGDIIEMTHDEIAIELGTAREVISRVIKSLEKEGYIQLSRGKVRVLNRKALEEKMSEY